jgi:serine O-acetyltransferase
MLRALIRDAIEMSRVAAGEVTVRSVARTVLLSDSYAVMATTRIREASRRWHVPGVNRMLRLTQSVLFGIELGKDIELGEGVYLVHTLGTVIGGTSRVGKRVRFMGNNTVGSAKDDGCPIIEDDVLVGCGARILGPIRIGARAQIGANAVVVSDVPADAVAVGVPAVIRLRGQARAAEQPAPPDDANGVHGETTGEPRAR